MVGRDARTSAAIVAAASIAAFCLASISSSTSTIGSSGPGGAAADADSDSDSDSSFAFSPSLSPLFPGLCTVMVIGLAHPSSFRPLSIAIAAAASSALPMDSTAVGDAPFANHSLTRATSPKGLKIFAVDSASKPLGASLTWMDTRFAKAARRASRSFIFCAHSACFASQALRFSMRSSRAALRSAYCASLCSLDIATETSSGSVAGPTPSPPSLTPLSCAIAASASARVAKRTRPVGAGRPAVGSAATNLVDRTSPCWRKRFASFAAEKSGGRFLT